MHFLLEQNNILLQIAAETVLVPTLFEFIETQPTKISWQYG